MRWDSSHLIGQGFTSPINDEGRTFTMIPLTYKEVR